VTATDPRPLAELLARAERDIAAQGLSYGSELDEDHAWRCAWNTWRTLQDLLPAVHALLAEHDTGQEASAGVLAEVLPLHRGTAGRAA
jgi:hypothetical protein